MNNFKIGLRTLKTAIAVAICIIICEFIRRDSPVLACLAAVYSLRSDTSTTFKFGKHRFFGTSIGVAVSAVSIILLNYLPQSIWTNALIGSIGVIAIIISCNAMKHPEGIITAVSTFLIISFTTLQTESVAYAISRIFDVVIGAGVAVCVDFLLPKNKLKK